MALLVGLSTWTGKSGHLDYHRYSGYALLGLLIFRFYWGFAGSSTARFAGFVRGPRAVLAYLRKAPNRVEGRNPSAPGHNPLGALSVIALLLLLLSQVVLGLFSVDVDGIESGPLSNYVSFDVGRVCAHWHGINFKVLMGFITLHVAAVLFYLLVKRDNLIAAMLHGRRVFPAANPPTVTFASWPRLGVGVVLAALVVFAVMRGFQF
jgi:cytochrome b